MSRIRRFLPAVLAVAALCLAGGARAQQVADELDPVGDLPGGGSITIEFEVTVASPVAAGIDQICNQGSVSGTNFTPDVDTDDPATGTAGDATCAVLDAFPDLVLAKSDGGITVTPGQTYSYTLSYSNAGTQGATGVVITETVPANTTSGMNPGWEVGSVGSAVPCNGQAAGTTCVFAVGGLAAGLSAQMVSFELVVDDPVPAGVSEISNTATIADDAANGPDITAGDNMAADTTPLDAAPDLSLGKDDGGVSAAPGGTVTYTLTYENVGNQGATGVVITETVPANTTSGTNAGWEVGSVGSAVPCNGQAAGTTCVLSVGAVAAGAAPVGVAFQVVVVNPAPAGVTQISNTATIADDGTNGTDPVSGNNTAMDTTPVDAAPDLTLAKSDGGVSTVAGGTVTYTLTYQNVGNQDATGAVITETVPTATTSGTNPGWEVGSVGSAVPCNGQAAGTTCVFNVGSLAAGAPAAMTSFQVVVDSPVPAGVDAVSNTAVIADDGANGMDLNPGDNTAMDDTPVTAAPDLTVAKDDGGVVPAPGDTFVYTITYSNMGSQGATGVVITETVPTATTSGTNPGWEVGSVGSAVPCDGQAAGTTCVFDVGSLPAGPALPTVTFQVVLDDPLPGGTSELSNTVSIADDGANGADENPGDNDDTLVTNLDVVPPTVTNVDTLEGTGDGQLEECETARVTITRMLVTFSEPVDQTLATDPASYLVVASGPDRDLETADCSMVAAGDVGRTVTGVTYDTGTDTATLTLDSLLRDAPHRLLVCSTITDLAGNPLDGDDNGTGGDDFLRTFRVDRFNLLDNPAFDCGDLRAWTAASTVPGAVTFSVDDADGASISGSAEADNPIATGVAEGFSVDQCVPVTGGLIHDLTGRFRLGAAPGISVGATAECELFDAPACGGTSLGVVGSTLLLADTGGAWLPLGGSFDVPAATASARCSYAFTTPAGAIFLGNADSTAFGPTEIFSDGFESGDVSAWTGCTGSCP